MLTLELEVAHWLEHDLEREYWSRRIDFNVLFCLTCKSGCGVILQLRIHTFQVPELIREDDWLIVPNSSRRVAHVWFNMKV
jgi:hypothetical protein